MIIQFTLQELMIFLLCAVGIAIGALSLPVLWRVNKIVGILRSLVESNRDAINKSITTMPGIFENAGQISNNVRETTDKIKTSVPSILGDVESVTHQAKGGIEAAGMVMENVGSGIIDTFTARERDSSNIIHYLRIVEEILEIVSRVTSPSR